MAHKTSFMSKCMRKASREATPGRGWTRVVPMEKTKPSKKKNTKQYLQECD